MLRKAATMAVCKINIDTDLRLAFTAMIRKHFAERPDHFDPRRYLAERPRRPEGDGAPMSWWTCWAATAKPDEKNGM